MKCFYGSDINSCERSFEAKAARCGKAEYIVERVVDRRNEYIQYCGKLCVEGVSGHLGCTVSLCDVSVIQSERIICTDTHNTQDQCEAVRLTLLCSLVDSKGCAGQGIAIIEINCRKPCTLGLRACVRSGAQIRILHACHCGDYVFEVRFDICMQTVFSMPEVLCTGSCREASCHFPPLYPKLHNALHNAHC